MSYTFSTPFASNGERKVVPLERQANGDMSITEGYGINYSRNPITDAKAAHMERDKFNYLFFIITEFLKELQENGTAVWDETRIPYKKGSIVSLTGRQWISAIDNNNTRPGITDAWQAVITDLSGFMGGLNVFTREETTIKFEELWNEVNKKSSKVVGDIYFKSRFSLDNGEVICNGDKFLLSSDAGKVLMSLDKDFRDGWGMVSDSKTISVPNLIGIGTLQPLTIATGLKPAIVASSETSIKNGATSGTDIKIRNSGTISLLPVLYIGNGITISSNDSTITHVPPVSP